ncbi:hypothetical protein VW35_08115 [Devosia soli]|uniref:Uncharacterized protein n=1 Tax=Devosia soli TaxID=361041 RepID=A0A0F5LFI0_9HYPH|nr:hypothetical protein VW35_08115 [Devosia soli]
MCQVCGLALAERISGLEAYLSSASKMAFPSDNQVLRQDTQKPAATSMIPATIGSVAADAIIGRRRHLAETEEEKRARITA